MAFWKPNLSVKRGWQPAQAAKGRIYSPYSSPMLQKCTIYITTVLCLKSMTATAIHTQPTSQTRIMTTPALPPVLSCSSQGHQHSKWFGLCTTEMLCSAVALIQQTSQPLQGWQNLGCLIRGEQTRVFVCLFVCFFLSNKGPIFTLTQAYSNCTLRSQFLLGFTPNKI